MVLRPVICPVCHQSNPPASETCAACGISLRGDNLGTRTSNPVLPAGTILQNGQYSLQGVLGQGGFGITYRGHDTALNRAVAIKEFFPSGCSRDGAKVLPAFHNAGGYDSAKARFLEEARTLARFRHPGIVNVHTVFEKNATAYMVMEYLQGQTLQQLIDERGALPEAEAVGLITRAGEALAIVHQGGLLHRDLKPANMILRGDANVVLIDFGAARAFAHDTTLHMTTTVTPGYAPLEQYGQQARFGACTDIYSLGATLYHLLTGQPPAQAPDRAAGIELKEPRELNPRLSNAVNAAIVWALAVRVDERPQTVREFLDSLLDKRVPAPMRAQAPLKPTHDFAAPGQARVLDLSQPPIGVQSSLDLLKQVPIPSQRQTSQVKAPVLPSRRPVAGGWGWVLFGLALLLLPLLSRVPTTAPPVPAPVTEWQPVTELQRVTTKETALEDLEPVDKKPLASPLPVTHVAPNLEKITLMGIAGQLRHSLYRTRFSPDGETIAAETSYTARPQLVRLWSAKTGALQPVAPEAGPSLISSMAFSPDGKTLICGYESTKGNRLMEGTAYLSDVDVQSGRKQIKRSPVSSDNAIALGPSSTTVNGDVLAIQTRQGVSLLDSKTLHSMARLSLTSRQQPAASIDFYRMGLDFSDNGKMLAVPLSSSQIQMWHLPMMQRGITLTLPNLYNSARVLSPNGDILALASDNEVALWNTRSGKKSRATNVASLNPITALDFSPDGKLLAVATWKGVTIYDAQNLRVVKDQNIPGAFAASTVIVGAVAFTPDSKTVQFMTIHKPALYRWHFK